jgi:hypothetical protein
VPHGFGGNPFWRIVETGLEERPVTDAGTNAAVRDDSPMARWSGVVLLIPLASAAGR